MASKRLGQAAAAGNSPHRASSFPTLPNLKPTPTAPTQPYLQRLQLAPQLRRRTALLLGRRARGLQRLAALSQQLPQTLALGFQGADLQVGLVTD